MPMYRLTAEKSSPPSEWELAWDDRTFALTDPAGRVVATANAADAHRLIDVPNLLVEGKVRIGTSSNHPPFDAHPECAADLRALVAAAVRADADYRGQLAGAARRGMTWGACLFVLGGGLFGLFCWYVSWAEDPPPGHWIRSFGWLIRLGLFGLLGVFFMGLSLFYRGMVQLRGLTRLERE